MDGLQKTGGALGLGDSVKTGEFAATAIAPAIVFALCYFVAPVAAASCYVWFSDYNQTWELGNLLGFSPFIDNVIA